MRYYYTSNRMTKIFFFKILPPPSTDKGAKHLALWKMVQGFLTNLNVYLPHNTAVPPKRKEIVCPNKYLYTKVHSSFIYNTPKLEQLKRSSTS